MPTGPTGATGWSGPTGWAVMPVTADHSADVTKYAVGWTWSGAPSSCGAASGTGVFAFVVYRNIASSQSVSVDEYSVLSAKIRYRVVVTNPATISSATLPRLVAELRCLSYAATSPLPTINSTLFSGIFGGTSGLTDTAYPKVRAIQYDLEREGDPTCWIITFSIMPYRPSNGPASRPDTGNKATKPNLEEAPWTLGPDVKIDFGTEDFVLGLGKFIATKTPAQLNTALENHTYAEVFGATGGTFEMVCNSAGDPLESPPPMKVGNANISITRSFENTPTGLATSINSAIEQVCSAAVTAQAVTFAAYTCKLNGASIVNKRWKKKADWLPKQLHPMDFTYSQLGWTPPTGKTSSDIAVNYTRNVLPAFEYIEYYEVSISVAQRDLGWGYALIDKGYRDKDKKHNDEFGGRTEHVGILENGVLVDTASGTTDLEVLRLYQVHKTGTALSTVLATMLAE